MKHYTNTQLADLSDIISDELGDEWQSLLQYGLDVRGPNEDGDYYTDLDGNELRNMDDVHVWYLQLLHQGGETHPVLAARFKNSIPAIAKIPDIWWAFLVLVSPGSRIPKHIDDEKRAAYDPSQSRNVLLSVRTPSEDPNYLHLKVGDAIINQRTGHVIIFDANIPHSGYNKTPGWWVSLVMVADKTSWEKLA